MSAEYNEADTTDTRQRTTLLRCNRIAFIFTKAVEASTGERDKTPLDITPMTVKRHRTPARAWLQREMEVGD